MSDTKSQTDGDLDDMLVYLEMAQEMGDDRIKNMMKDLVQYEIESVRLAQRLLDEHPCIRAKYGTDWSAVKELSKDLNRLEHEAELDEIIQSAANQFRHRMKELNKEIYHPS